MSLTATQEIVSPLPIGIDALGIHDWLKRERRTNRPWAVGWSAASQVGSRNIEQGSATYNDSTKRDSQGICPWPSIVGDLWKEAICSVLVEFSELAKQSGGGISFARGLGSIWRRLWGGKEGRGLDRDLLPRIPMVCSVAVLVCTPCGKTRGSWCRDKLWTQAHPATLETSKKQLSPIDFELARKMIQRILIDCR